MRVINITVALVSSNQNSFKRSDWVYNRQLDRKNADPDFQRLRVRRARRNSAPTLRASSFQTKRGAYPLPRSPIADAISNVLTVSETVKDAAGAVIMGSSRGSWISRAIKSRHLATYSQFLSSQSGYPQTVTCGGRRAAGTWANANPIQDIRPRPERTVRRFRCLTVNG
jgi:hypothetical protein